MRKGNEKSNHASDHDKATLQSQEKIHEYAFDAILEALKKTNRGFHWWNWQRSRLINNISTSKALTFKEKLRLLILAATTKKNRKAQNNSAWAKLVAEAQKDNCSLERMRILWTEHKNTPYLSRPSIPNSAKNTINILESNLRKELPDDSASIYTIADFGDSKMLENALKTVTLSKEIFTNLLAYAVWGQNTETTRFLLNMPTKISKTVCVTTIASEFSRTPLMRATVDRNTKILTILLENAPKFHKSSHLESVAMRKYIEDPDLDVQGIKKLLPIYWSVIKQTILKKKKAIMIANTGDLERLLAVKLGSVAATDFITRNRPENLPKDVTDELVKISTYYEEAKKTGRTDVTQHAKSIHRLHPQFDVEKIDGLCHGFSSEFVRIFLEHPEMSVQEINQKIILKFKPRPGGPAVPPIFSRIMRLQEDKHSLTHKKGKSKWPFDFTFDDEDSTSPTFKDITIEDNEIYSIQTLGSDNDASSESEEDTDTGITALNDFTITGHALLMGKRDEQYFLWDVNNSLKTNVAEYNTLAGLKEAVKAQINTYETLSVENSNATLVTPEMLHNIAQKKHHPVLKKKRPASVSAASDPIEQDESKTTPR
jgi:hypothetical protein